MEKGFRRTIYVLLLSLVLLDIVISFLAFFFPETWFKLFHNSDFIDPQGFLRRCAANWTAFALIQTLAFIKWERKPYWLAIVAGVRFSDIFTDWAYLWFSSGTTHFGKITLFFMSPFNLLLGLLFLNAYKRLQKT